MQNFYRKHKLILIISKSKIYKKTEKIGKEINKNFRKRIEKKSMIGKNKTHK